MRQGLAAFGPRGQSCPAVLSGPAGRGLWAAGAARGGLRLLAEALAVLDTARRSAGGRRSCHRLQGRLAAASSASPDAAREAEACFQQALDVARRQQAKSLELRAAMSLASPLAAAGQAGRSLRAAGTDLWLVHRGL